MDKTESLGKSRKALHNGKCFPVFWYDRAYKPGSVLTAIYLAPQLLTGSSHLLGTAGQAYCPTHGVAPDRVYIIKPMSPWAGCALTAPFHPCLVDASSISLAPPQAAGLAHFAASPLPTKTFVFAGPHLIGAEAVSLCCTCPGVTPGRRYLLSLPCGARTFLIWRLSASIRGCPARSLQYCTLNWAGCQISCKIFSGGIY